MLNEIRLELVYDDIRFTVLIANNCGYIDVSSDVYEDWQIDGMMSELEPVIVSIVDTIKYMVQNDLDIRLGKEREIICGKN
ncbi:MAG: hypothetical protein WCS62_04375 [Bacilli bacterium]